LPRRVASDAPLEEFRRKYAFMRLPAIAGLTEEQDKQRYIFAYHLAVFLTRSATAVAALIVASLLILSGAYVREEWQWLLQLWPPTAHVVSQLTTFHSPAGDGLGSYDLLKFTTAYTAAHAIWLVWLAINIISLLRWSSSYQWKIPVLIPFGVAAALIAVMIYGPTTSTNQIYISYYDGMLELIIKEALLVSLIYWNIGLGLVVAFSRLRAAS